MEKIILSDDGLNIFNEIKCLDDENFINNDYQYRLKILSKMRVLYNLIKDYKIVQIRSLYFFDKNFYKNSKISRHEIFIRNGTNDNDVYIHPHFYEYLNYFIDGIHCYISDDDIEKLKKEINWNTFRDINYEPKIIKQFIAPKMKIFLHNDKFLKFFRGKQFYADIFYKMGIEMLSPNDKKNDILNQYHICEILYNYAMNVKP